MFSIGEMVRIKKVHHDETMEGRRGVVCDIDDEIYYVLLNLWADELTKMPFYCTELVSLSPQPLPEDLFHV